MHTSRDKWRNVSDCWQNHAPPKACSTAPPWKMCVKWCAAIACASHSLEITPDSFQYWMDSVRTRLCNCSWLANSLEYTSMCEYTFGNGTLSACSGNYVHTLWQCCVWVCLEDPQTFFVEYCLLTPQVIVPDKCVHFGCNMQTNRFRLREHEGGFMHFHSSGGRHTNVQFISTFLRWPWIQTMIYEWLFKRWHV